MDVERPLPFPVGSEIELQIVNEKGEILRGEDMVSTWKHVFDGIEGRFSTLLATLPEDIRKKVKGAMQVTKARQGKQLMYLEITYATLGRTFSINIIGPDPNISQVTWLMELVTPPCTSLRELAWWGTLLNKLLSVSLPRGKWVLPLGINPLEQEYASGVTFGEHYHLGIEDPGVKLAAYTLIRNFIPHLVALTVNSPFLNKVPTGTVKVTSTDGVVQVLGKDCIKSLRLSNNKAQLGPVDKDTFIPCMDRLDRDAFCQATRRVPPDDRFVDVYPFTPYGTIEVRVFDTQFSQLRRQAIAALLEALALKAMRLHQQGTRVPCVMPAVMSANREKAVIHGLHGKFQPDGLLSKSFGLAYNEDPVTGRPHGKLFQAVSGMLFFLKGEIKELGIEGVLAPFRVACEGTPSLKPPVAPSDWLLLEFDRAGSSAGALMSRSLKRLHVDFCATDAARLDDPVLETFGRPVDAGTKPAFDDASEGSVSIEDVAIQVPGDTIKGSVALPFSLQFRVNDPSGRKEVDVLVIQHLVELLKRSENVLASTSMKTRVRPGEPVAVTERDLPLVPAPALFTGSKQCRLKCIIKAGKEATVQSSAFRVEPAPKLDTTSDFRKRKVSPGEKHDIHYKVSTTSQGNDTTWTGLVATMSVHGVESRQLLHERKKPFTLKDQESLGFKLDIERTWDKERGIEICFSIAMGNVVIARHESGEVSIDTWGDMPRQVVSFPGPAPAARATTTRATVQGDGQRHDTQQAPSPPAPAARPPAPAPAASKTREPRTGARSTSRPATQPAPVTPVAVKKPSPEPAKNLTQPPEGKHREMERVAKLLDPSPGKRDAKNNGKKDHHALPFSTRHADKRDEVTVTIHPPRAWLLTPAEKHVISMSVARKHGETRVSDLQLVCFLIDDTGTMAVVHAGMMTLAGSSADVTVEMDLKRVMAATFTSDPRLECIAFDDGKLAGRGTIDGFELARFATRTQLSWKRVDLLCATIYPEMDAGITIVLEVKQVIATLPFTVELTCQAVTVSGEFTVDRQGRHEMVIPVRMPVSGLVTQQDCPAMIKIRDKSGMVIKEQRRTVTVIPRGPLFEARGISIDTSTGFDKARLEVDLVNEGRDRLSCTVDVVGRDLAGRGHDVTSRRVGLAPGEIKHVEMDKVHVSLALLAGKSVDLDFMISIPEFNKISQVIRGRVPRDRVLVADRPPFEVEVKNLDNTHDVDAAVTRVTLEVSVLKHVTASNCKAHLIENMDGIKERIVGSFKLPRDRVDFRENHYWTPTRQRGAPCTCKLYLIVEHDGEIVPLKQDACKACTFLVHPAAT